VPRRIFPASTVTNTTGAPLRLTFHATSTTGRRETDLYTVDGSNNLVERIPNGVILTDVTGAYSAFAGPDDVDTTSTSGANGGSRRGLRPSRASRHGRTLPGDKNVVEYASATSNGWGLGLQGTNRFVQFVTYGVKAYVSLAGVTSGVSAVVAAQFKTDFSVSAARDNNQVTAVTGTADIAGTPATVSIGAKAVNSTAYFDGHIRRVVIFNRTLTNDELQQAHRILARDVVPLQGTFYNAASPLTIPTYDGSNQLVHMDVIAPATGTVCGYRYVMAMTPLPNDSSTFENPSIVVSQDNVTWAAPAGLTNPIDTAAGSGTWNSDTDLTWDGSKMWLLFRTYVDAPLSETLYVTSSTDLVTWTAKQQVLNVTGTQTSLLSPAVVWDGTQYVMYVVNEISTSPVYRKIQRYTAPAMTGPWSGPVDCTIPKLNLGVWHVVAAPKGLSAAQAKQKVLEELAQGKTVEQACKAASAPSRRTRTGALRQGLRPQGGRDPGSPFGCQESRHGPRQLEHGVRGVPPQVLPPEDVPAPAGVD
jgi:hypothetical protein